MKLSWKLFFITTPLFVLFLTLFGVWMIQDNFQNSLDREIQRCMVENQMFQNSYELTRHSLSEDVLKQTSEKKLVESFYQEQDDVTVCILNEVGFPLYQEGNFRLEHHILDSLDEENNVGYELIQREGAVYLVVVCCTDSERYIETAKNITAIYKSRTEMYSRYQTGVLFVAALVGLVTLLALFFVMRNMRKLSLATRKFADGQYNIRVKIKSSDEVGILANDFNWMADCMNRQMNRLQNEVERQEAFTSAFAHELKTPLTSIIGYADTIRQMNLDPEETAMCADYIYRQGKRLQTLSYKLLELTMARKPDLSFSRISVTELVQEIVRTSQEVMKEKHLNLVVSVQEEMVWCDRELLASLLLNLLDNSRKASEPGQDVYLKGETMPDGYRFMVEDEGKGIPPEEMERVTEAFYMVDKSRARKEGGAGLGLTLCAKIIQLHRGRWNMENKESGGLRVIVEIPSEKRYRSAEKEDV